jgi:hypothetical protein
MSPKTFATFDMVQRAERAGNQPVSLLSRIVGRGPDEGEGAGGLRLRFCGLRGADLRDSALCREPELLSRAEAALQHGYPVVLSGRFVPGEDGPPQLVLQDIQPVGGAADLLCPHPEERRAAAAHLAALRKDCQGDPDAFAAYVLREAQRLLGLRAGGSPRYQQVQRAVLLQALSGGPRPHDGNDDEDAGGRLSLLTLSSPGRSKRTLALLAQLLAPVAMMGQGATLTPAELAATVTPRPGGGLLVEPGMLVRGDGGVVVIEDFHAIRRHREPIQRALCQAMEEGRVAPLGPSGEAEGGAQALRSDVALYLDLSLDVALHGALPGRTSQTLLSSPGFATELLSRMDVIACVDAGNDVGRSARGAVWSEADRPPPQPVEEDLVKRRRDLQLLVSLVRDEIRHVELDPVAEDLVGGFFDRSLALGEGRDLDAAAFVRRSSLSLRRLCAAAARLRLRERAGPEDAQLALSLFSLKIETLTWLSQQRAGTVS